MALYGVRVFRFLLSGLFCCLGFSVVIFLLFGRGPQPRPNSKKNNTRKAQTAKKKHAPAPSENVCCFAVWVGGRVFFFAVWAGSVFFFLLFGRGACSFFAVWAGGVFFFCCLGGGRVFFCLGRERVFLFAVWAGTGVHSLTGLPGSSSSDPTTKKAKQQKKKTGSAIAGLKTRNAYKGL